MHDHHLLLYGALAMCTLLTLATVIHAFCKRLKAPFAVGLLISGLGLGYLGEVFGFSHFLHTVDFSPAIIFYVFLPTLIFESAYHLNFRTFQGVIREVISLSTIGLILSMMIVASGLHFIAGWDWTASLLFGALISATDPVAVLAVFKELKAPKKLSTIVDGESLINDGTSLVFFQFFLKLAITGVAVTFTVESIAWQGLDLLSSLFLGLAVGIIFGVVFSSAIAHAENKGVRLTLSLVLAHMAFLVAEGVLGVSGILATMAAGLVMGNFGRRKLKPQFNKSFSEIWNFLGFLSNALVFMLLGLKLGEAQLLDYSWLILLSVILTLFIGRFISVFIVLGFVNLFSNNRIKTKFSEQTIIAWGGIRGALGAAAVLMIPDSYVYAHELQAMTAGVILASFILNATTIGWLLRKFRIVDFTQSEKFQSSEARLIINEDIIKYLDSMLERKYISEPIHKKLKAQYDAQHEQCLKDFGKMKKMIANDARELEKVLTHFALGIEMKTYRKLFAMEEISEDRFVVLQSSILRQTDRLDHDILPDERKASNQYAPLVPKTHWLASSLKKMGFEKPGERCFEILRDTRIKARLQHYRARRIASWKVVYDLEKLKKDHPVFKNCEVTRKIIERYRGWNKNAETKMDTIEREFPDIVIPLRTAMAERSCLERERELEKEFLEKGFISEKIYAELDQEVHQKQKRCRHRCSYFNFHQ